jgi:hypothetical protein
MLASPAADKGEARRERRKFNMSASPEEVILAVEGDEEAVECSTCQGAEGSIGDDGEWHDCVGCGGEGFFWRKSANSTMEN